MTLVAPETSGKLNAVEVMVRALFAPESGEARALLKVIDRLKSNVAEDVAASLDRLPPKKPLRSFHSNAKDASFIVGRDRRPETVAVTQNKVFIYPRSAIERFQILSEEAPKAKAYMEGLRVTELMSKVAQFFAENCGRFVTGSEVDAIVKSAGGHTYGAMFANNFRNLLNAIPGAAKYQMLTMYVEYSDTKVRCGGDHVAVYGLFPKSMTPEELDEKLADFNV
ncbi:MAG: hypothetical protein WCT36_05465 [Candidatus Gracilibacteria bacterium]|jgi:hypothetical protein